jgi:LysR family transcriptional regulator (chromosome initiation inhibitor)
MVPDLQASGDDPAALVEFDPGAVIDVPLYWQQWRRSSATLERVTAAVCAHAAAALR